MFDALIYEKSDDRTLVFSRRFNARPNWFSLPIPRLR